MQVRRSDQPALHVEPALRLVGATLDFIALFGGRVIPGDRNQALAASRRVVLSPLHLLLGRSAGTHGGKPRIYPAAWVVVAVGIASLLAPLLERHVAGLSRWLLWTFPVLLGSVLVLVTLVVGADRLKAWRKASRPLPPVGSPNVLLVVMDTVRADHLSVYGYERPTTPTLERLAKRGIRFDNARATAPWTLPSHASFFSGRWPHELGAGG